MDIIGICNLALDHLGAQAITSLDEASREAAACSKHYNNALLSELRIFDWPFARTIVAGASLETEDELMVSGWSVRYQYPTDCLRLWGVVEHPSVKPVQKFMVAINSQAGGQGKVVFSNLEGAYLRYTKNDTDPTYFDEAFAEAFSYKLASRLAMPITRDDKKLANMHKLYVDYMDRAKIAAANEDGPDQIDAWESDTILVRGKVG